MNIIQTWLLHPNFYDQWFKFFLNFFTICSNKFFTWMLYGSYEDTLVGVGVFIWMVLVKFCHEVFPISCCYLEMWMNFFCWHPLLDQNTPTMFCNKHPVFSSSLQWIFTTIGRFFSMLLVFLKLLAKKTRSCYVLLPTGLVECILLNSLVSSNFQ